MAHAFKFDEGAPAPNLARDEAVGSTPHGHLLYGSPNAPLGADPAASNETNPAETALDVPGPVDQPEQADFPTPAADVLSFCDAVAAHDRDGSGRGPSVPPADQMEEGNAPLPAAPTTGEARPATPEPYVQPRRGVSVFELLLGECEPPPNVGALAHAGSLTDVRCGHADPAAMVNKLQAACTVDELRAAGVVVVDELGHPHLHPDLAVPTQMWLVFRDASGTIYEVVGQGGGLRTRQPAVLSVQWDQTFQLAVKATGVVVVVFTVADMVLLRALGVAAVLATDLARVPIDAAERVAVASDSRFRDETKNGCPDNDIVNVLLAAWSIVDDDPTEPPDLDAIKDHLGLHSHQLGYADAEVFVWRPTSSDRSTMRWLIGRGDATRIAKLIENALDKAPPLIEPAPPRPPKTFMENLETWLLAPELDSLDPGKLERNLSKQNYDTFIAPLFQQAVTCADPEEAILKQIFALRNCEIQRRLLRRLRDPQAVPSKADADIEHQQLNDLLKMAQVLKSAYKPPPARGRTIVSPSKTPPVLHIPSYRRGDQT